mmetsp:Transcript_49576/g.160251  ORF Transcript_49576/g.160251 Transcript_49576/m.160251 type:complete len:276 (-) Transcript_49576:568-1395(-)
MLRDFLSGRPLLGLRKSGTSSAWAARSQRIKHTRHRAWACPTDTTRRFRWRCWVSSRRCPRTFLRHHRPWRMRRPPRPWPPWRPRRPRRRRTRSRGRRSAPGCRMWRACSRSTWWSTPRRIPVPPLRPCRSRRASSPPIWAAALTSRSGAPRASSTPTCTWWCRCWGRPCSSPSTSAAPAVVATWPSTSLPCRRIPTPALARTITATPTTSAAPDATRWTSWRPTPRSSARRCIGHRTTSEARWATAARARTRRRGRGTSTGRALRALTRTSRSR